MASLLLFVEYFIVWVVKLNILNGIEDLLYYFCNLLLLSAIILLKPSSDILSGLSKLDYLYIVSDFQRYKDQRIEIIKKESLKNYMSAALERNSEKEPSIRYRLSDYSKAYK